MALQWFKMYGAEYLSDTKISSLTPQERSCWITLLCLASISSEIGKIEFLTIESLLDMSGIKWDPYNTTEYDNTKNVLQKLDRMKMIKTNSEGIVTILNWNKRQEHNLTVAERVAKHRRNKQTVTTVVTNVTSDKTRLDKIRLKKEIEKDETSSSTPFSLKDEIKKLENNPQRNLNIIGLYFEKRNPTFENYKQYQIALRRHLKPSKLLENFTDNQILNAIEYAEKEYKDIYTLETLIKILTK